jgi:YD repeat-containing protein
MASIEASNSNQENGMPNFLKAIMKCAWVLLALSLANLDFPAHASDGSSTHYEYDELGRLIGVTDAAGNSATYRFDAAGNIRSIVRNSASQPTIMEFTPNGGP